MTLLLFVTSNLLLWDNVCASAARLRRVRLHALVRRFHPMPILNVLIGQLGLFANRASAVRHKNP